MAGIGSEFWSGGNTNGRLIMDTTSATTTLVTFANGGAGDWNSEGETCLWDAVEVSGVSGFYQRPFSHGSSHDYDNGGYFYVVNSADSSETRAESAFCENGTANQTVLTPTPENLLADHGVARSAGGGTFWGPAWVTSGSVHALFRATPSGDTTHWGTFTVKHYQPLAWCGYPARTMAAICLDVGTPVDSGGTSSDFIDIAEFDNSYDEHAVYPYMYVYCAREVGRRVADLLKDVVRNTADILTFTADGKIALMSRDDPTTVAAADLEGVKHGETTCRWTDEHLCNTATIRFGSATYVEGGATVMEYPTLVAVDTVNEVANPDYEFKTSWDATLSHAECDAWTVEDSNATSISRFGDKPLGGQMRIKDGDETKTIDGTARPMMYDASAGVTALAARVDVDGQMRREVTLVQDLRGLDYEVGHKISNLTVASESSAIADLRCTSKHIDWNHHEVTSVLLEEPSAE